MDYDKNVCPIINVDGGITGGKQFDIDITLPKDNRNVVYGVIKNCDKEPIENATVKLIEVVKKYGKEEHKPIGHTFTDKDGEFVFGPLCPDRFYELQIWVNQTKHVKICAKVDPHETFCLKGFDVDCCDFKPCVDKRNDNDDTNCETDCCDEY